MVPTHLGALYLDNEQSILEPLGGSRLFYFHCQRDVNPDIANISEEIVALLINGRN